MQRLPSTGRADRPKTIQSSKSFTRYEPEPSSSPLDAKASTIYDSPVLGAPDEAVSIPPIIALNAGGNDIFDKGDDECRSDDEGDIDSVLITGDQLPEELESLIETFLESLGAKVHPTPLSIDKLSQLFQDFYDHAYEKINGHITVLSETAPPRTSDSPSVSSSNNAFRALGAKRTPKALARSGGKDRIPSEDHQMLTPSEIAGRRRERRKSEQRRYALEEAVERSICEKVYPRIWRHRSTDDEERDEKLKSRAAALALVGVDLHELLSTASVTDDGPTSHIDSKDGDAIDTRSLLAGARENLLRMNDERYPLGKLNHLKAAHKSIVEALEQILPSESSADEVLPALIFTVITSDPQSNYVISNFNFIQRFRASDKVDGETAYCLTNLEAAITFLETVDLSSLRADEAPEGPGRAISQPSTPGIDANDPLYHGLPSDLSIPVRHLGPPATPSTGRQRVTNILAQPRQRPFETQSDAVLKKADEAFETIHSALDGSFKFLFGHLRERQVSTSPRRSQVDVATPRTLEDARRLVSSNTPHEDDLSVDGSSIAEQAEDAPLPSPLAEKNDGSGVRVMQMIGGLRTRERSVDSGRSGDSGSRKVSFAEGSSPVTGTATRLLPPAGRVSAATSTATPNSQAASGLNSSSPSTYTAVESMRTLGTTLNPLRGLTAGMGMVRGFARTASVSASTPSAATATLTNPLEHFKTPEGMDLDGIAPPVQRFVECKEVKELNGFEVELLLRDYQRLAGVLRALREGVAQDIATAG